MKKYFSLFALALAACTNGQGQADVTMENTLSFAATSSATAETVTPTVAITTDGSVTVNVQDELDAMSKLGTLTATVSKNSLAGASLAAISHIKTTIATEDGKIPAQVLTDVDVPKNSTAIELPLLISDDQVLDYLKEGEVSIHFYLTGTLSTKPIVLTHTLIAHVDVAVQSSVLKL